MEALQADCPGCAQPVTPEDLDQPEGCKLMRRAPQRHGLDVRNRAIDHLDRPTRSASEERTPPASQTTMRKDRNISFATYGARAGHAQLVPSRSDLFFFGRDASIASTSERSHPPRPLGSSRIGGAQPSLTRRPKV